MEKNFNLRAAELHFKNNPNDMESIELAEKCTNFANEMFKKLMYVRQKKGFRNDFINRLENADDIRLQMYGHIDKGDPVDVANYCLFLYWLGQPTATPEMHPTSTLKERILKTVSDEFDRFETNMPKFKSGKNQTTSTAHNIPPHMRDPELQLELPLNDGLYCANSG